MYRINRTTLCVVAGALCLLSCMNLNKARSPVPDLFSATDSVLMIRMMDTISQNLDCFLTVTIRNSSDTVFTFYPGCVLILEKDYFDSTLFLSSSSPTTYSVNWGFDATRKILVRPRESYIYDIRLENDPEFFRIGTNRFDMLYRAPGVMGRSNICTVEVVPE